MTVKLCTDSIRIIALFENITNVHAKDCIIMDNSIYFVVELYYFSYGEAIKIVESMIKQI